MTRIYKILGREEWRTAEAAGSFAGAGIDLAHGFIHFSTASQAAATAERWFRGRGDLVVLEVESEMLGDALRWEVSRGGELFPHLYGQLPCAWVVSVREAPLGEDGAPRLGDLPP